MENNNLLSFFNQEDLKFIFKLESLYQHQYFRLQAKLKDIPLSVKEEEYLLIANLTNVDLTLNLPTEKEILSTAINDLSYSFIQNIFAFYNQKYNTQLRLYKLNPYDTNLISSETILNHIHKQHQPLINY